MNTYEITIDRKKACIYEIEKAAREIGELLGAAVKASHIQAEITKEQFWRDLFIKKGTDWDSKLKKYSNDRPLRDSHHGNPELCPEDPYREMDLQFWLKYLLDGYSRVKSEENETVSYAEDSLHFYNHFGLTYTIRGDYPQHRTMGGTYRNNLLKLKNLRNTFVGHSNSKLIEEATRESLKDSLQVLLDVLEPLCKSNWAGKKYAVALRESICISFYHSLQELPYALSELLDLVNMEPESIDREIFAAAGIRMEEDIIFLRCDPANFINTVKTLTQMALPAEIISAQLDRLQNQKVDEAELLKLSVFNEAPLSEKERKTDLQSMTPEELLKKAEAGDPAAQMALAEHCYRVEKDFSAAFRWWSKAAESGLAEAQRCLGRCYRAAIGVGKNLNSAIYWYQKAAEQGNAEAQYQLYICYRDGIGVAKDPAVSFAWLLKAAEQNYIEAQYSAGFSYDYGKQTEKDLQKAMLWYQKAAEQGHRMAQNNLGTLYADGVATEKDLNTAFYWYQKSAEQGYDYAQNNLGRFYENGYGVEKDVEKAAEWYRKAAEQGHVYAQSNLARCCESGIGVEKNTDEAIAWYRKAAMAGHASAQFSLAYRYSEGMGIEQDKERAANWYKEAAEQGNAAAINNLGVLYEHGNGVPKNERQAVMLYRRASRKGNAIASRNLAQCYEKGIGVEKNLKTALTWAEKALESTDENQRKDSQKVYDRIQKQLSKNA